MSKINIEKCDKARITARCRELEITAPRGCRLPVLVELLRKHYHDDWAKKLVTLAECDNCNAAGPADLEACPFCGEPNEVDGVRTPSEEVPPSSIPEFDAENLIEVGPDLSRVVDEASQALAGDPNLFKRDGNLATVLNTDPAERFKHGHVAPGSPVIRELSSAILKERLSKVATFARVDEDDPGASRIVSPPADVVAALIDRGEWPSVRPIVGILEAPSLRPDGSLIEKAGYDDATGYVLVPSLPFPPVPPDPSREDAARALAEIGEVFADFKYAGESDAQRAAHRAVPIAALLTVIARPAIAGPVPAMLFDAPTAGSGKSLQVNTVGIIGCGRAPALMAWPSDETEQEKVLGSFALIGAPIIAFDNLTRAFAGAPLDRCLTATDCVQLRVLGKSEVPSLPWRAVVMASGNNLEISGDTCRRVLLCRIDPECERPDERDGFLHPDLPAWALRERPRLVVAALTLLRAYVVAGRPAQAIRPFGSFEAWTGLIASAIVFAGGGDPTLTRQEVQAKGDPHRLALGALLGGWQGIDRHELGLSAKEALEVIYIDDKVAGPEDPLVLLREAVETLCPSRAPNARPTAHQLGVVLRRARDRVVAGRVLRGEVDRNGVTRWRVTETSPASPAEGVSVRGMRGMEGDVSTFAHKKSGSDQENVQGYRLEHPPHHPHPPQTTPTRILPRSPFPRRVQ